MLVGLAPVKERGLDRQRPAIGAECDDAVDDVRRIEDVMGQRRRWIFGRRRPVHERNGAKCRVADRTAGHTNGRASADRLTPGR